MSDSQLGANLQTLDPPWVHVIGSASEVADSGAKGLVAILDGSHMRTLEGLFREFVRALDFPEYFGWNWNAFEECITDLTWRPAKSYLILVREGEQLLADDRPAVPTFRRVMEDAGRHWARSFALGPEWGGGEVPFNLALLGKPPAWD